MKNLKEDKKHYSEVFGEDSYWMVFGALLLAAALIKSLA